MKRNLDLIKTILEKIEQRINTEPIINLSIDGESQDLVNYQIYLMNQAELINAEITRVGANEIYDPVIFEMTWTGHEFLDSARNETVWNKTKELVKDRGGSVSFEVFQTLLKKVAISTFT